MYNDIKTKLSYVYTYILRGNSFCGIEEYAYLDKNDAIDDILKKNENLVWFKNMIEEKTGKSVCLHLMDGSLTVGEWQSNIGYIDHQSADIFGDCTKEQIEEFIFGDSLLFIENDNDDFDGPGGFVDKRDKKD